MIFKKNMKKLLLIVLVNSTLFSEFIRDNQLDLVVDTSTGLIWEDVESNTELKTLTEASEYCKGLNDTTKNTYGVLLNWRLPNYNELYSLVDHTKANPSMDDEFQNKQSARYWTSTISTFAERNVWRVNFTTGFSENSGVDINNTGYKSYVRCVHDYNN